MWVDKSVGVCVYALERVRVCVKHVCACECKSAYMYTYI